MTRQAESSMCPRCSGSGMYVRWPGQGKRCAVCNGTGQLGNRGEPLEKKRGRPAKPQRCVVQLRVREGGKVTSYYSVTVALKPGDAMKRLQDAFSGTIIH